MSTTGPADGLNKGIIRSGATHRPAHGGVIPVKRILIADDEPNIRRVLSALLQRDGHEVLSASDGEEARLLLQRAEPPVDAILTDFKMPGLDGMGLLRYVAEWMPDIPVVLLTAHGTVDTAVQALKQGAFDYLTKPFDHDEIRQVIAKALKSQEANSRSTHAPPLPQGVSDPPLIPGLLGNAPSMKEVHRLIAKVASSPTTILVRGESGTGKELVATALHRGSDRARGPLIKVNCTAIPETLFESELFGHERGAFTGAINTRPGRFELADKGTVFLDEIGELPREMQPKLLRALQERTFERVGGLRSITVDVRLVAATHADLEARVREGTFREDLFYRLNVVPIYLPALRERREDIPLLASHFLASFNRKLGRRIRSIGEDAMDILLRHSWPGNVRELENVLERAVLLAESDSLTVRDLPQSLTTRPAVIRFTPDVHPPPTQDEVGNDDEWGDGAAGTTLKDLVRERTSRLERDLIRQALEEGGWNVTRAARRLGLSRKGLQNKMKELGLREERPV